MVERGIGAVVVVHVLSNFERPLRDASIAIQGVNIERVADRVQAHRSTDVVVGFKKPLGVASVNADPMRDRVDGEILLEFGHGFVFVALFAEVGAAVNT